MTLYKASLIVLFYILSDYLKIRWYDYMPPYRECSSNDYYSSCKEYICFMTRPVLHSTSTLDAILSLQIAVAWAGEGLAQPKRLNWWRTDLVDEVGGGDLLHRLLPRTGRWASLSAARQAAIQVDRQYRQELVNSDSVRTLYFWGFDTDEALQDRLSDHKRSDKPLEHGLPLSMDMAQPFSTDAFEDILKIPGKAAEFKVVPGGRELIGNLPASLDLLAQNLAAALLPLAESYPMPFYRVDG
jgi:hypothetical protein